MTNGIKIPISGDVSGLNQAMNDFQQKAKSVFKELNGTAKIDTTTAKQGMLELEKSIQKVHDALSKASSSDMGGKAIDTMSAGFEEAVSRAKALEQAVGGIGGKTSSSFNKAVSETRKLLTELEKAKRLQATLAKQGHTMSTWQAAELEKDFQFMRQNAGGAKKKIYDKFGSMNGLASNWRDMASNEVGARRQYNDVLRQLGLNAPGGAPAQQQRTFAQFVAQATRRAVGGVVGAATPGSGVGGSIAQGAIGEAAGAGGLFSMGGAARIAGGLGIGALAYGAIRGVSAVAGKMGSSEEESIGYADMLRGLGSTASSFDELRDSVRSAAKGLDMSFGDGSKMASTYIKGAGIDGLSKEQIRAELSTAGGFGRSMGLSPESGAGMFATLRHNKVTGGDSDNKRFALMIGEAVARAGVFTKADDVLAAVAGYTQQATRAAASPANVEGYMGAMSNLMNLRQAGLDPNGVASMLGTVDSSMRHGGGEAQRNFLLGALQSNMPGMTAVDMGYMQDAGMFAKAKDVFKEGNPAYDSADAATRARYKGFAAQGGDKTFFDMAMAPLSRMGSDEQRKNMMGLFNLNDSQAASLQNATRLNGGSLSKTFSRLGSQYDIDPSKMNDTSLRNLIDVEYGDPSKLKDKASWLRTQNLSAAERGDLDAAEAAPGAGNENLKQVLVKLGATRNMEMTAGDESRKNMTNLDNMASDMATKLIPMTNSIREGIAWLAAKAGYKDTFGNSEKAQTELSASLSAAGRDQISKRDAIAGMMEKVNANPGDYTPEYRKKIAELHADSSKALPGSPGFGGETTKRMRQVAKMATSPSQYDDIFKSAAKKHGVDWLDLKQIAAQESDLSPGAVNRNPNGSLDRGIMQLNNKYDAERGVNDGTVFDPAANINAGAGVWASVLKRAKGDKRLAFQHYNGSGPAAEAYANNAITTNSMIHGGFDNTLSDVKTFGGRMLDSMGFGNTPLPPGAMTAQQQQAQQVNVNGNFTLTDPVTGRPRAAPIQVSQIVAPRVAGVR